MTDIVERLCDLLNTRPEPEPFEIWRDALGLALVAADEIKRLRKIEDEWATLSKDDGKAEREIERLRAELATLRASSASVQADQRAERDALRADALRYRWLRDCDRVSLYRGNLWLEGISSLDAAIDAAMAARTTDSDPEVPA